MQSSWQNVLFFNLSHFVSISILLIRLNIKDTGRARRLEYSIEECTGFLWFFRVIWRINFSEKSESGDSKIWVEHKVHHHIAFWSYVVKGHGRNWWCCVDYLGFLSLLVRKKFELLLHNRLKWTIKKKNVRTWKGEIQASRGYIVLKGNSFIRQHFKVYTPS